MRAMSSPSKVPFTQSVLLVTFSHRCEPCHPLRKFRSPNPSYVSPSATDASHVIPFESSVHPIRPTCHLQPPMRAMSSPSKVPFTQSVLRVTFSHRCEPCHPLRKFRSPNPSYLSPSATDASHVIPFESSVHPIRPTCHLQPPMRAMSSPCCKEPGHPTRENLCRAKVMSRA